MKTLNTKEVLKNFNGDDIMDGETPATVGFVLTNILSGRVENPHRAYQLGRDIALNDTVELRAEDVVYLKKCVEGATHVTALVSGQIIDILERKDVVAPELK